MKMHKDIKALLSSVALGMSLTGCAHTTCSPVANCDVNCDNGIASANCNHSGGLLGNGPGSLRAGYQKGKHACSNACWKLCGGLYKKSNAVPETLPLGSTIRSFDQVMETNAEAVDFIFHRHDFIAQTAKLTPDGRDKIVEIASRMSNDPFPVLIERSENNSNPELDALRRNLIATILTDFGHTDAQHRTIVAPAYGPGYTGQRAEQTYYQHIGVGNNAFGGNGNGFNNGGGFGGNFGGGFGGNF